MVIVLSKEEELVHHWLKNFLKEVMGPSLKDNFLKEKAQEIVALAKSS
jgi:hypothetical protein